MDVTSYLLGKKAGGGSAPVLQDKEVEITQNGETTITADSGYDGLRSVDVDTNVQPDLETKSITITENTTTTITPTSGKDGLSSVEITTNVPSQKYAPRFIRFSSYTGTELDYEIENLDTKNINKMSNMFGDCSSLTRADISNWNTSNVTNMYGMFYSCSNISSINADNIDTSKVENMSNMFNSCSKLTNLQCSNWNTSNVTDMSRIFQYCSYLTSLDIRNFTSTALTDCSYMFGSCKSLMHIDMRSFNFTKSGLTTSNMFGASTSNGVPNTCEIIVADNTQKAWLNTNFSRLTNVKTVAEYEGS